MNRSSSTITRRHFVKTTTASIAATAALSLKANAAGSEHIRVGVLGCGNRGGGAIANALQADKAVEIVAIADAFPSGARFERGQKHIQKWLDKSGEAYEDRIKVPNEEIITGFNGYKKVLAMKDVDIVFITTPANFHPMHLRAAIEAGKHVFIEKPGAVDPPGARSIIESGELAKQKGLSIVAGTQRRHQASYLTNKYALDHGAIGRLVSGRIWWCGGGSPNPPERLPGQNDAEYMVRNWYKFSQMSGDHIVEQHLHNVDVANWFVGRTPVTALGFGGRARRQGGNQYDFFSVDFDYGDDVTIQSMCRQIQGCYTRVSEHFAGTDGSLWGGGKIKGKSMDIPEFEEIGGPYVQEHRDLIASIRNGKPINEAKNLGESTLTAIMGRISAYTGQLVRWADLTENKESQWYSLKMEPNAFDFENGTVVTPEENVVPLPG